MPKYDNAKLIHTETGEEIKPGTKVQTRLGEVTFLYVSRLPEGNSSGRVMTDDRPGGEYFPSVLDGRIEVPAPVSEKVGELFYWALLDNHEPSREQTSGIAEVWRVNGAESIRLPDAGQFKDYHRAIYLLDDGKTVVPHYVVGWNQNSPASVTIQPMPVNPEGKKRADRDEPIDFSNWALGPRRAYHLKIKSK